LYSPGVSTPRHPYAKTPQTLAPWSEFHPEHVKLMLQIIRKITSFTTSCSFWGLSRQVNFQMYQKQEPSCFFQVFGNTRMMPCVSTHNTSYMILVEILIGKPSYDNIMKGGWRLQQVKCVCKGLERLKPSEK
jgi:hypothetical protein